MHSNPDDFAIHYTGERGPLFNLALKTGFLTLATLGIYRFWQKTRLRKYIWSSTNAGGDTFEYTGTGMEKFLGFLLAVLFLAVYVGLIQMVLFFFGLTLMTPAVTMEQAIGQLIALYVTIFAVVPFLLFAVYRARRYKMARTRWRGIRFGMEKGAWGFVWRAIGHGLLTLVTLGALLPRQVFFLEKYMTDRSWYGDARFVQEGKWTDLYGAMKHVGIGIGLMVLGGVLGAAQVPGVAAIAGGVGYVWLIIGLVYFGVRSFGYLTSHKRLGADIRFVSAPRTGTVLKTYILGSLLVGLALAAVIAVLAGLVFLVTEASGGTPGIGTIAIGAIGYVVALIAVQALALVFIVQPILAHYIGTITVTNPDALNAIRQREAETGLDAEGFADALDIGGAI
ncbi:DUF898 family protein [Tropicibacter oceani]|uniref:DUF898 family protein n=1 Tax=Tropicibacter oceani TaxID=3058420 RepID=A0ABY8QME8_9RHOB|nr:DUF898 family protein [Tropicibacter oceani]WGW05183.1 DUF898 family protein [Tropicibacter oceani]